MTDVIRRVLAVVACALVLASCRLDVAVDLTMQPDGTGEISVVITADAALVADVPTIADELATDDIAEAGWVIEGPSPTPDGGLVVTLTHGFTSDQDATNLLNSLGPPFNQMAVSRSTSGDETTTRLDGLLGLPDGFASFADDDLVAAVGSLPFDDRIAASGATPETALGAVIRADLPGEIDDERTNGARLDDGRLEWVVPTDGSILEWQALTVQAPDDDRWWARPLSIGALVLLVGWVAFMTVFIGYVALARWRRARRYRRRPTGPHAG